MAPQPPIHPSPGRRAVQYVHAVSWTHPRPPLPPRREAATSITNGPGSFSAIVCALCHDLTPSSLSPQPVFKLTPGLVCGNANAKLCSSDKKIHHMGQVWADNVSSGVAGGDQSSATGTPSFSFPSSPATRFTIFPLCGPRAAQSFSLHDGRTANLLGAIPSSPSNVSEATQGRGEL